MSIDKDNSLAEAVAAGTNVVRALRDWARYSVEELALTCGLAVDEIVALEAGDDDDGRKLSRIAAALGVSWLMPLPYPHSTMSPGRK